MKREIEPDHIELISWAPKAWLYRGFLSDAECEHLIRTATPHMTKSTVCALPMQASMQACVASEL